MTDAPTAAAIQKELRDAVFEQLPTLFDRYGADPRTQVQKALATARRRYEKEWGERERVEGMYGLMRKLGGDGVVIGVDEVGRGPLAGPLTVAAVVLPASPFIWGIDDSKKLSPARREELAAQILALAPTVGMAHIEPHEIDACGMAASLRVAMRRAIEDTGVEPDAVLIDGLPVRVHPLETRSWWLPTTSIPATALPNRRATAPPSTSPPSKGWGSLRTIARASAETSCRNPLGNQFGGRPAV